MALNNSGSSPGNAKVDSLAIYGWFLAFTGLEWLRYKIGPQPVLVALADLPNLISVLEIIEIAMILRLIRRSSPDVAFGWLETLFALAIAGSAMLILRHQPLLAAFVLSAFLAWRFRARPSCRRSSLVQLIFIGQFVVLGWPFLSLHNLVGQIDATVVRTLLRADGQDISGYGTYIIRPSDNIGFDVMWGCATSTTLVQNIAAFGIITGGLRGFWLRSDLAGLLSVVLGTFALNWLRLVLICRDKLGYLFWHEGSGAIFFAVLYAILIVVLAYGLTRPASARGSA